MKNMTVYIILLNAHIALSFHNISEYIIKKYLPENPVILEAGAHWGNETIEMSKVWPKSTIYAFEPLPQNFTILKGRTKSYQNIKIFSYALSDQKGKAKFNVATTGNNQSSSLLDPKDHIQAFPDVFFDNIIEVDTISIDEWAEQEGVTHIDFIWFDLQGSEYPVLKASPKIMSTVRAIFTEVNYTELYHGITLYPIYKKWLEDQGFREVHRKDVHPSFGDALFVRQ